MSVTKSKKKEELRKRSEILKNWFSSFFITVGVVIVVVAFVPKSPVVTINDIKTFSQEVFYQVNVEDEDEAIIDGTLRITLENQFEYHEQSLERGLSSGVFLELQPSTEYTLKILADKGFGGEVLERMTVVTSDALGGGVISNELMSEEGAENLIYQVGVYTSDPYDEVDQWVLDVYYAFSAYTGQVPMFFSRIPLNEGLDSVSVNDLFSQNYYVMYSLIGISGGVETVYDSYAFYTPVMLYGSVYVGSIGYDHVYVYAYVEPIIDLQVEYTLNLIFRGKVIDSIALETMDHFQMESENSGYLFDNLQRNTLYDVELVATYVEYDTGIERTVSLGTESFRTSWLNEYSVSIVENEWDFTATVVGNDPNQVYDKVEVVIYQGYTYEDELYYYYYDSFITDLTYDGDSSFAEVIIDKPTLLVNYRIVITVMNSSSSGYRTDLAIIEHVDGQDTIDIQ